MKLWRWLPILACLLTLGIRAEEAEEEEEELDVPLKYRTYDVVDVKALRVAPEKYNYKKVCFDAPYKAFSSTFPKYMVESGFEADDELLIDIGDWRLPVIARKNDDWIELFTNLKPLSTVRAYGVVRRFREKPKVTTLPHYYLKLEFIVVRAEPTARKEARAEEMLDRRDQRLQQRLKRARK